MDSRLPDFPAGRALAHLIADRWPDVRVVSLNWPEEYLPAAPACVTVAPRTVQPDSGRPTSCAANPAPPRTPDGSTSMGCLVDLAGVVLALFIGVPVAVDQGAPSPTPAPSPVASELVVARAADGKMGEVVATVDDEFICSAFRRGRSESSGCATSLPPDAIAFATGSDRPPVAHGMCATTSMSSASSSRRVT